MTIKKNSSKEQLKSTTGEKNFDWEQKKVLDFEKNWKTGTIKESIYSEENEDINGISFKLPNIWKPILPESKAKKTTASN